MYSSAHKLPLLILLGKFYYMSIVLGIINSSKLRKVEFVTACVDQVCSAAKPFGWFVSMENICWRLERSRSAIPALLLV